MAGKLIFKLSQLQTISLKKGKECLGCRRHVAKDTEVLSTGDYSNGIRMVSSIFCTEDCFLIYDDRHWRQEANKNQGRYKANFN